MKLFDAHCHLQDKRVIDKASQLISAALAVGVTNFTVNGTSEVFSQIFLIIWSLLHMYTYFLRVLFMVPERLGLGERDGRDVSFCCSLLWTSSLVWILYADDFQLMQKVSDQSIFLISMFLVCRFIADRSPHWFNTLMKFFETTPTAAVGEVSLFISCNI